MLYNSNNNTQQDVDFDLTQTVKQYLKQTGDESLLSSFMSLSVSEQSAIIS